MNPEFCQYIQRRTVAPNGLTVIYHRDLYHYLLSLTHGTLVVYSLCTRIGVLVGDETPCPEYLPSTFPTNQRNQLASGSAEFPETASARSEFFVLVLNSIFSRLMTRSRTLFYALN